MISNLEFNNEGRAVIKTGKKVIAKATNLAVFYQAFKIKAGISKEYPFNIEITGCGIRQCKDVEECIKYINLYVFN